jgi:hypothetical protein
VNEGCDEQVYCYLCLVEVLSYMRCTYYTCFVQQGVPAEPGEAQGAVPV